MNKQSTKVRCEVCRKYEAHVLLSHLKDAHSMTALDYSEKHPGSPVLSKIGADIVRQHVSSASSLEAPEREAEEVTIEDLLGFQGDKFRVKRLKGEAPWVPAGNDEGFHYDYDVTMQVLYALHRKRSNSLWISGYSGTGKTSLVVNLARRLNRELIRVNMDASKSPSQIVGDWVLRNGETRFQYGPLPIAMKRGAILLLDEFDLGNPYVVALFRPVLEEFPRLLIEDTSEEITPHEDFRIVACANSFGAGDETGLYGTVHTLSLADRQRFGLFVQIAYLKPEVETQLLMDAVPDLDTDEAAKMVRVATRIRDEYSRKKLEESISPRQLVNWADVFTSSGDAIAAANMAFLLPLSQPSQLAIRQIISEVGLECRKE